MICDKCTVECCWKEFGKKVIEMAKNLYSTDSRVREVRSPCGRVENVNDELVEL